MVAPLCALRGMIEPGCVCGSAIGAERCASAKPCEDKIVLHVRNGLPTQKYIRALCELHGLQIRQLQPMYERYGRIYWGGAQDKAAEAVAQELNNLKYDYLLTHALPSHGRTGCIEILRGSHAQKN